MLDGWRGLSILLVLAAHLLPVGPKALQGNRTAGVLGMTMFFALSGFLITRFLLTHDSVLDFFIRRLARIVPLAWLAILVAFTWFGATAEQYAANLLFVANLPPTQLLQQGSHVWSLCVEFQFYVAIALTVALLGRRGLLLLPLACVAVTLHRINVGVHVSIVTYERIDEILAGGVVALAYSGTLGQRARGILGTASTYVTLPLLVVSCHPAAGAITYLRPYFVALLLGSTLVRPHPVVEAILEHRILAYIAEVSYALYVIHNFLAYTWLGSGDLLVKYLKRPLLFGLIFALAHLSTFYFEQPCIALGKRLSRRLTL